MSRYTVWSVGKDGNQRDEIHVDSPKMASMTRAYIESDYRMNGRRVVVGITDNENPEDGDVSDKLLEGL